MSLFMKHFNGDCSNTYTKCMWEKIAKIKCNLYKVECVYYIFLTSEI